MVKVCFVCLGNICRSPTAEAIFLDLVEKANLSDSFQVESAGTAGYHVGEKADKRSRETAASHGITILSRSRKFTADDADNFDYIIAMDLNNKDDLSLLAGGKTIHLLRDFDDSSPKSAAVPDPYYGGDDGFQKVFEICRRGCEGLLEHIKSKDLV